MKSRLLLVVFVLFGAAVSRGDVTSDWAHAQDQYSPPVLANGDFCGLFDYRNMMGQDHPSYRFIKCTGGLYRPSIYREGRRTDNRKLACLGRIEERVAIGGAADAQPVWWRQGLETRDAISLCENGYADGTRIDSEAFVHSDRPVIAVRKSFSGPAPDRYTFEYLLVRPDSADAKPLHTTWVAKGDELRFTVERDSTNTLHGTVRLVCDRVGAKAVPTERGLAVTIEKPRGDVAFYLTFSDDFRGRTETPAEVSDWASLRADHVTKWNAWTDRSFVRIPDARLKKVYDTALYNLRCWSTEWSIPVGILPSHWNGSFFGFTFFGPALGATGHEDDLRKVARYWHSLIPAARIRASRAWDDDPLAGIRFTWLPDEQGAETCGNGRWLDHVFHMGTVCHEAMTCWRYHEDEAFLRETVYPLLHESALFYENQSLVETDGRLIVGTCCDLERFRQPVKNAFLTTCAVISTFENAAEAATRLGVDADAAVRWRTLANRLRASLPRRDGRYIPYADADERSVAVLAGLVPCETLAADDPLQRAAVYDFDAHALEVGNMVKVGSRICTWYAAWAASAEARLGDGEGARRNLLQAAKSCGCFGEIFEMNEPGLMSIPWCSSPQGTFVQAVNDMLLQCRGDEIRIAPAVPKDWTDYSFRLKAYDDITVDCTCANGRISYRLTRGAASSGREKRIFVKGVEQ